MKVRLTFAFVSLTLFSAGCSMGTSSSTGGASCTNAAVSLSQQVANPISYMSTNNNGITLQFPYLSATYGTDVAGYALLGVASTANNTPATSVNIPSGTTFYSLAADTSLTDSCYTFFQSTWGGHTLCGFIDSGSNSLVFPNPTTSPIATETNTSSNYYGFYKPSSPTSFSATNIAFGGGTSISTPFTIENVEPYATSANVLSEWGIVDPSGPISGDFDWGLPFFLGRTVFVGLEGKTSSQGSGLYWSYPTALNTASLTVPTGSNVLPVTIGGYGNEPYVTVTICVPGTSTCTTIPNILLDTGSSGLRLFASALPSGFAGQLPSNGVGECESYGDNSVQWGSVQNADITLGGQTASSVPIHVINTAYGDGGASCYSGLAYLYKQQGYVNVTCPSSTTAAQSQTTGNTYAGCPYFDGASSSYNGILGVNFLAQDCGTQCASNKTYLYYSCQ